MPFNDDDDVNVHEQKDKQKQSLINELQHLQNNINTMTAVDSLRNVFPMLKAVVARINQILRYCILFLVLFLRLRITSQMDGFTFFNQTGDLYSNKVLNASF